MEDAACAAQGREIDALQETVQSQAELIARMTARIERLEGRERQREDLLMHLQAVVWRQAHEHQQHLAELQFAALTDMRNVGVRMEEQESKSAHLQQMLTNLQDALKEYKYQQEVRDLQDTTPKTEELGDLRDVSTRLEEQEVKSANLQQVLTNLQDDQISQTEELSDLRDMVDGLYRTHMQTRIDVGLLRCDVRGAATPSERQKILQPLFDELQGDVEEEQSAATDEESQDCG